MNVSTLRFLLSPAGQTLLAEAAALRSTEATLLADLTHLRKRYPAAQVAAALETVRLRGRAAAKFGRADRMYFTAPALEQASGEEIAAYRARRYQAVGAERVADLGCGVGGDSLALAAGAQVLGIDLDELRLAMAQANCSVYDRGDQFQPLLADLRQWLPVGVGALFFDPGRRTDDGRRIYSVSHYRPPLETIQRWLPRLPHLAVKVSPGVDYAELPPGAEIEFISEKGAVKEAVLWFGDLRTGAGRRATLLPGGETLTDEPPPAIPVRSPGAFLYEPDGAVIRAHLVEQLADRLGAAKLDRDIAYLTADAPVVTPFARAYALEGHMPFNLKKLRAHLRARNVGRVVVKKRGSPLDPEELMRRLRLRGDEERVLFLTRVSGRPSVLVGRLVAN
jgi:SAM-dependent methyltransferase